MSTDTKPTIPDVFHDDATVRIACVEGSFNLCDPGDTQHRLSVVIQRGAQRLVVSELFDDEPEIPDFPTQAADMIREKANAAWINTARAAINAQCDAIDAHADLVDTCYATTQIAATRARIDELQSDIVTWQDAIEDMKLCPR